MSCHCASMTLLLRVAIPAALLALGFTWCAVLAVIVEVLLWYADEDESPVPPSDFTVNITGGGFAGICMGMRLKKMGVKYTIYEMAPSVGGVWWDNRYPGCACDIPSHLYSLSNELKPDWSRQYSPREEILQYLQSVAKKHDLNIVYNTRAMRAQWHPDKQLHSLELSTGETVWSNLLVSGFGALREPTIPNFPGSEKFKGKSFHSSRWDASFSYSGKKVAVIGTGASGVQIIPEMCREVEKLYVFQRTPCWAPKRFDFAYPQGVIKLFQSFPLLMWLYRLYLFFTHEMRYPLVFRKNALIGKIFRRLMEMRIRHVIKDPKLAQRLTPDYEAGCKRITPSDDYLDAFNRENVELIVSPIVELTETGIKTEDGNFFEVDGIVYATGFSPLETVIKAGEMITAKGESLAEILGEEPVAFLGACMDEFPNAFMILGPNTGLGHNSIVFMIECHVNYISQCIRYMIENKKKTMVVRHSAMEWFKKFLAQNMPNNVFFNGCKSWYRGGDGTGYHYVLWPSSALYFWWLTKKLNPKDFEFDK